MQNEMVVVENDNRQMQIGDMREMMVHDIMELNGEKEWFSSKKIAKETGKNHTHILADIKSKSIDFADGKKYWANNVNGGKTYSAFKKADLANLFKKLVVENDERYIVHKYFQGLKWEEDNRGYITEFWVSGYVITHFMTGYDDDLRWDWQMFTRSLYAENTELIADKYLGIFDERATFNYDNLTKDQKIEISTRYSIEHALENGLDVNPGLIPNKVMKKISDAKKTPYITKRNKGSKTSNNHCTDNRRFNKGSKTGRRWLSTFNFDENEIFSLETMAEQFHTSIDLFRLFLVDHNLIKRKEFTDGNTVATPYLITNKWANRTIINEWDENLEEMCEVKGIEFTAHGLRYISKLFITKSKKYKKTQIVGTTDIEEFLNTLFEDYCDLYKFTI